VRGIFTERMREEKTKERDENGRNIERKGL
jgi:hypothetical protein